MTAPTSDPGALLDRLEEARKAATGLCSFEDYHAYSSAVRDALPDLLRLARDGLALRAGVERLAEEIDTKADVQNVLGAGNGRIAELIDLADRLRAVVADTSGQP